MADISVIVPVYNEEQHLRECLESIISQSYEDWEMIIVDDASTDKSEEICLEYARRDTRIRYHRLKKNGGLSHARNTGLGLAEAPYTVFLDSDDCYAPFALAFLHTMIAGQADEIGIARFVNTVHNPFIAQSVTPQQPEIMRLSGSEALVETLYQHPMFEPSVCAKIFRTDFIRNFRFKEGMWYEDIEFVSRLYPAAKTVAVSDVTLYFYRRNPHSFINTWSESRMDALKSTEIILSNVAEACPACIQAARSRRFSACYNIFLLASANGHPEIADRCWNEIKALRADVLLNPKVRIKNKAGAAVSYLGRSLPLFINHLIKG